MPNHQASRAESSPTQVVVAPAADIDTLVADHYSYIRRLALSILDDPHEADDAAQDTFIAACRALGAFRGEANPKTWLTAITVNACRSRLRKRKMRHALQFALETLHLASSSSQPSPEKAALEQEANSSIWRAVDDLDEKHRLVVVLRYVHELPIPEIAEILGTNAGTVYSRLHYARHQLQARLGNPHPQAEVSDESP
jgi:RNA polymerase sigma-70 factor, ECF subfamily